MFVGRVYYAKGAFAVYNSESSATLTRTVVLLLRHLSTAFSDASFATDASGLRSGTGLDLAAGGCDARLSAISETR